jgi:hypothetical protein
VKKEFNIAMDFEGDKLINSIENTISSNTFATNITLITMGGTN